MTKSALVVGASGIRVCHNLPRDRPTLLFFWGSAVHWKSLSDMTVARLLARLGHYDSGGVVGDWDLPPIRQSMTPFSIFPPNCGQTVWSRLQPNRNTIA